MDCFAEFVKSLNSLSSQVYAFITLLVGVFLILKGHDVGKELVVGGFALLRVNTTTAVDHIDVSQANVKVDNK